MSQSPYITDDVHAISLQSPSPVNSAGNLQASSFIAGSSSFPPSYNNSPYSGHSDLSGGYHDNYGLFPEDLNQLQDYNPDYGTDDSSLLIFDGGDFNNTQGSMLLLGESPQSFDYPSPASTGGADSGTDNDPRSRNSSISSPDFSNYDPLHAAHSPRAIANHLESLSVNSPHLVMESLPSSFSPPFFPQQPKASPPRLQMPEGSQVNPGLTPAGGTSGLPTINAPDGDGIMGPQLHVVPATPITRHDGGNTQGQSLFHQPQVDSLGTHQDSSANTTWGQHQIDPNLYNFMNAGAHTFQNPNMASGSTHNPTQGSPYLLPASMARLRSKSDPELEQPDWANFAQTSHSQPGQHSTLPDNNAVDDIPIHVEFDDDQHSDQAQVPQANFYLRQDGTRHSFTPNQTTIPLPGTFLSPDSIRRTKSEQTGRGHRLSRSEDFRGAGYSFPRREGFTLGPSPVPDFLDVNTAGVQQIRQHIRRASSGTRSDHATFGARTEWLGQDELSDGGGVMRSGRSSSRASPYPSPNASPRVRYDYLPAAGMTPRGGNELMQPLPSEEAMSQIPVKQTVTTPRTSLASHKRRKQEATFACPIAGCTSTFTRSFNLRGHIRSHNEEKPFECPWPGCKKGFARQHDCRRHEQLHTNYRPFSCEGCGKRFARMDALNRHLRSEGGADCLRILESRGKLPPGFNTPNTGKGTGGLGTNGAKGNRWASSSDGSAFSDQEDLGNS